MHMDELAAPAHRRGRARAASASTPRASAGATCSGWRTSARGASRASSGGATGCPSGTAATRPTSAWTRPTGPAGSATPTCSTPGSRARCGRSRRSAGPTRRPSCKAFYPTDVLSTARDILFLWVARMVFMGLEFAGDIPFDDVYVHSVVQAPDGRRMSKSLGTGIDPLTLIDGGPRPPVFTEGGDFPAYGADAVRYGLLAMSSTQDVRFNEEHDRRRAASSPTSSSTRRGSCSCACRRASRCPTRAPAPETVEDRWILSRLQAAKAELADAIDDLRVPPRRARRSTASSTASCATGTWRCSSRGCTTRTTRPPAEFALHVLAETLALAHPVIPFVTEEIWSLLPGRSGPADGAPLAGGRRRRCATSASRRRSQRAIEATQALRALARRRRRGAPARAVPARLEAEGYERVLEHVARLARFEFSATATRRSRPSACPAARAVMRVRRRRHRGRAQARRRARDRAAAQGDRARRGQARQPGLRRQGAGGRGRRPSATSWSGSSESWRNCSDVTPGTSAGPRSTCSRSSCSACASGWSGCAGC